MKQRLLWRVPEPDAAERPRLSHDLLLSDAVFSCYPRTAEVKYFLNVLSLAPRDARNTAHRAGILRDFQSYPLLLDRLKVAFRAFDSIPDQYSIERNAARAAAKFGTDARYLTAIKQVITGASTLMHVFSSLEEIAEILTKNPLESEGFTALVARIRALLDHPEYQTLSDTLDTLVRIPEDYLIELQFTLGKLGRFVEYDILSIDTLRLESAQPKGIKRLFQSAKSREAAEETKRFFRPRGVPVYVTSTTLRNQTLGGVYEKTAEILHQMLTALFEEFCGMARELEFYQVAMGILSFFEGAQIPFCYPEVTQSGQTEITGLFDFVLLCAGHSKDGVVPNDVLFSKEHPGILIRGDNNTGKTVYLRSIATAMLFAQSGLPVPASEAVITPGASVYTLFASGEKVSSIGTGAGRFEEEVSELSALVDVLQDGDILFLNEVFQTTSYAEGARGLYHILRYLNRRGVRFICVTHLEDLFTLFSPEEIVMLQTAPANSKERYRLLRQS